MLTFNAKESLSLKIYFLQLYGYWPQKESTFWYQFRQIVLYALSASVPFLNIVWLIQRPKIYFKEVANSIYFMPELLAYAIRMVVFVLKKDKIEDLLEIFESNEFNQYRNEQKEIVLNANRMMKLTNTVFYFSSCFATAACGLVPLFAKKAALPLDIWTPFDLNEHKFLYLIAYVFCFYGVVTAVLCEVSVDIMIASFLCHTTARVQILKDSLSNLQKYLKSSNSKTDSVQLETFDYISQCSKYHLLILKFAETFESTFGTIVFFQFAASTLIICSTAFLLTITSPTDFQFYWMITYMLCMLIELLLYCWFGTNLYYESATIPDAIFTSQWYAYDEKSKKALIAMMEMCKKPISIKAAKLFDLSLETLKFILQKAGSLFAVMQRFNSVR